MTKLQISPLLPGLRMSTLAKNVSQVVLYENQVSDFVALLRIRIRIRMYLLARRNCFTHDDDTNKRQAIPPIEIDL